MKTIQIHNLEQTNQLAYRLADELEAGSLILLSGDLGAGKTTFTKALGKQLGVKKTINSPTFTILKTYHGRLPMYHIDAYRLEALHQDLGFEELFDGDGVCIVEWPQYVEEFLPADRLEIQILRVDDDQRTFLIHGIGDFYEKIEEKL
ncbi:MAG: tRNA (adenosine(37)-N6)-threonylcarbamoyltransferase complex ATPase subunit type 1 TsaE [Erysipelotrichaceae bacterium]